MSASNPAPSTDQPATATVRDEMCVSVHIYGSSSVTAELRCGGFAPYVVVSLGGHVRLSLDDTAAVDALADAVNVARDDLRHAVLVSAPSGSGVLS